MYMIQHEIIQGQTLYQKMIILRDQLMEEIAILKRRIAEYPEGELCCSKNQAYTKWHLCKDGQNIYLPKSQREFACVMADKKYLTELLRDLQHDLDEVNQYLQKHQDNPGHARKLLTEQTPYTELLIQAGLSKDLSQWANASYETNPFHPENKIHTAPGNIRVRSKSEVLIATLLFSHQIPFRYECVLHLGLRSIYPDFTLRHPQTGETFYWEHFGKMDDPVYRDRAYERMQFYSKHQIYPNIQLITTSETADHPLSIHTIECRIQEFFSFGQLDKIS